MNEDKDTLEGLSPPHRYKGFSSLRRQIHFRPLALLIGTGLSLVLLWLAFRDVPIAQILDDLADLDWAWVAIGFGLSVVGTILRAARWRLLYYPQHEEVKIWKLSGVLFFSQMVNVLIPLRAGEIARIFMMYPISKARTLGTIVLEKFLDILTLFAFLLLLPLSLSLPGWFTNPQRSFFVVGTVLIGAMVLLFFLKEKILSWLARLITHLPKPIRHPLEEALAKIINSFDVFRNPMLGLQLQTWSFLIWGSGFFVNYLIFFAFRFDLPLTAALFVLLVLQIGISVPNIPGKLGIFQYSTILALAPFGVDKNNALSYSLVLYLVGFGPHFLFGSLYGLWQWIYFNTGGRHSKI